MKPFSPNDIAKESIDRKIANIPDFVIEVVNDLLAETFKDGKAQFNQNEVIERIQLKKNLDRQDIFNNKYLDFEECFRKEGWIVKYHKGAYYEDWTPYFTFEITKS
jgi:hypothetical protein